MKLISPDERDSICRKFHIQDSRMALASALLKRAFICKTFRVPWYSIKFGRKGNPLHGKPAFLFPNGSMAAVDFNISHQAGLVVLVGTSTKGVDVGVDITCVNERNDFRIIDAEGFDSWIDMYEEVFSDEEIWDMKYTVDTVTLLDGTEVSAEEVGRHDRCLTRDRDLNLTLKNGQRRALSSELIIDSKLRRFYTFYAYKEGYIKLVGEGLLARWLRQLEFRNVRSPRPGTAMRCSTHGSWGEKVDDVEVWIDNRRIEDVSMEIQAYEEDMLICTAVRRSDGKPVGPHPPFKRLDLQTDILDYADKK